LNAPIGVFDSGVGGLTVVRALTRRLPREPLLYLGDTARLPYGTKSPETVARYTARNVAFLVERGVKAIVVACNSASATALDTLAAPVPIWGVIQPGAKAALSRSRNRRIGVIATEATILSDAYRRTLLSMDPGVEVFSRACPLFVPLVEEGWEDGSVTREIARRYLEPLREEGVDTLILGCTHYPLLTPTLRAVMGDDVTLVDSASAVAESVAEGLAELQHRDEDGPPRHHVLVTDSSPSFESFAL